MESVKIACATPYEVAFGDFAEIKSEIAQGRAMLVTDDSVYALYCEKIETALAGVDFARFVIPHGEASKNAKNYIELLNAMAEAGLSRADAVVAVGGGVTGDLAGFAAATYMRGVRLYQVPTTLLAMIDSSVGGKTGIDLASGKNMAGAFYQPKRVTIDIEFLKTLPAREISCGLAEAVKIGILFDRELFFSINDKSFDTPALVRRCVELKANIVAADEREAGPRRLLNLGHTIGHALEKLSDYSLSHGAAVAIGTCSVSRAASKTGLLASDEARAIIRTFASCGLPVETNIDKAAIARAMLADKKRAGNKITFVVPRRIGECELIDADVSNVFAFIETEGEV